MIRSSFNLILFLGVAGCGGLEAIPSTDGGPQSEPAAPALDAGFSGPEAPPTDAGQVESPPGVRCDQLAPIQCPSIDACADVLAVTGLIVDRGSSEETYQRSSLAAWMCDSASSLQVLDYFRSQSGALGFEKMFSYAFDASASQATQRSSLEAWQRTTCRDEVSNLEDHQVRTLLSRIEDNRPNIDAWAQCVSRISDSYDRCMETRGSDAAGLAISFSRVPGSQESFTTTIRWCGSGGDFTVRQAEVLVPLTIRGATCFGAETLSAGEAMNIGDLELACVRDGVEDVSAALTVVASLESAARNYSASNFLPSLSVCTPSCDGRTCGDDGCGGTCGGCATGESCLESGQCSQQVLPPEASNALCNPGAATGVSKVIGQTLQLESGRVLYVDDGFNGTVFSSLEQCETARAGDPNRYCPAVENVDSVVMMAALEPDQDLHRRRLRAQGACSARGLRLCTNDEARGLYTRWSPIQRRQCCSWLQGDSADHIILMHDGTMCSDAGRPGSPAFYPGTWTPPGGALCCAR